MSEKRRVAGELCVLYHEAIRSEVTKQMRGNVTRLMPSRKLDEVDKSTRRAFLAAARVCIELEADPREYIVAQFGMWREASAYYKKMLWPMPQHLGTLSAHVRFLQHKAREEVRLSRVSEVEDQDERRRWYVEERNLKGLARATRRDPVDVLTETPEDFSREFLQHKGVWDVVSDVWQERQRS